MSQKNIRESLEELAAIVERFEHENLSIEEAITQFEKGSELSADIKSRLSDLKTKITVLTDRFDQE